MKSRMLVTVHSGGSTGKMNSIEYLEQACRDLPDVLEVDVRSSRDGKIVLWHDEHLPQSVLPIKELAYEAIKAAHPSLLSLQTVLSMCGNAGIQVNLDIKTREAIEPVHRLLASHEYRSQVMFSGCQEDEISDIHRLLPGCKVLFNADRWNKEQPFAEFAAQMLSRTLDCGAFGLNICHEDVLPYLVKSCKARAVPVFVWTVDDPARMEELIGMGVDSITTHEVNLLKSILNR
ncbi:MAG: glycerophosphodiester phosphodiesterase [Spirochaetales bacterium]|nr:glycerophosphodiester phosphodiesterase [Spirochaetales bacterium]